MNDARDDPRILVLGSVTWETVLMPKPKTGPRPPVTDGSPGDPKVVTPTPAPPDEFVRYNGWVGAPTVREMICNALVEVDSELIEAAVAAQEEEQLSAIKGRLCLNEPGGADAPARLAFLEECGEITAIFARFQRRAFSEKKSDVVLRVERSYYAPSASPARGPGRPAESPRPQSRMQQHLKRCIDDSGQPDIIVVYDGDPHFRTILRPLLADLPFEQARRVLIVAMVEDVDVSWASTVLSGFQPAGCDPKDTVVLVTVEALRRLGLNIVEYGSIEQTVKETAHYLARPPLQGIMERCGHLVLIFEETGVIYLHRADADWVGSIHFCPNFDRVAQMDREMYGNAPGRTGIALAAIVKQVDAEMRTAAARPWNLEPAVRLAVAGYNLHFSEGFEGDPFRVLGAALDRKRRRKLELMLEPVDKKARQREFLVASLDFPLGDALKTWSRVSEVLPLGAPPDTIRDVCREIVTNGVDRPFRRQFKKDENLRALGWFPMAEIKCPYLEVGKIKTVDAAEISGFSNLAKLMTKYLRDDRWETPLSIAVFGPPGSGKSFAVKELLKTVNPAAKGQPALTYNLAQFDSVAVLTEAFHQVQDRALSSADVPLVIFDEFDCKFGSVELGWLKYFLAPMQDGLFRGASNDYRVGRSIFLFAGGTSASFEEFRVANGSVGKSAKLNDFISRLKGYLDVLDINPPDEKRGKGASGGEKAPLAETKDNEILRKVRRAMILRSLLLEYAKPIVQPGPEGEEDVIAVNEKVIDAFLNVERYEHGVRSMEAVIRMSRWIGGQLLPASIPSQAQLEMHAKGFWPALNDPRAGAGHSA